MNKLATFLNGIKIGEVQQHENMRVYALHIQNGHVRNYLTLDEALEAGHFEVKEVSTGGSVPELAVVNGDEKPVLLVIGEELIGAKQNRVLNTTILVPAKTEINIPVSCVEQGRWSYRSDRFASGGTTSHFKLRKEQTENVTARLRTDKLYDADQSAVWGEVSRKMYSHASSSPTQALHEMYAQTDNHLKDYLDAFNAPEAQGFLVTINGAIAGADVFDHHETLQQLFSKLIRSYAIDALERKPNELSPETENLVGEFIAAALGANEEVYESPGLGNDLRLSGKDVSGSSLIWQEKVIHTSLFNAKG